VKHCKRGIYRLDVTPKEKEDTIPKQEIVIGVIAKDPLRDLSEGYILRRIRKSPSSRPSG
jgi:hypothetical protein